MVIRDQRVVINAAEAKSKFPNLPVLAGISNLIHLMGLKSSISDFPKALG
jgi:hypothetical protein